MDATVSLTNRLILLRRRLTQVRENLASIDRQGYSNSAQDFDNAITDRCLEIDSDLKQPRADAGAWGLLRQREEACKPLFREALAFLQTLGGCKRDLVGPAGLASALVAELSQASVLGPTPLIVPDVDDSFSDFVQNIRLRFPAADLWDVPVVAHEFGHFAAYRLTASADEGIQRRRPFPEYVAEFMNMHRNDPASERDKWRNWLNEFFADAFATFVMGPSFAASVLLLRSDVALAFKPSNTHPSYAARAKLILDNLQRASDDTDGEYNLAVCWLTEQWRELLKFAEGDRNLEWVDDIARKLYEALLACARNARYSGWKGACNEVQFLVEQHCDSTKARISARDLVNGAWVAVSRGEELVTVSTHALEFWQDQSDDSR